MPRTEERIQAIATLMFFERGYHGTSMREIAAEVGVQPASLYNHFPSKQDILFRIAASSIQTLLDGARTVLTQYATADERLRALIRLHVSHHAVERHSAKVGDDQLHALEEARRAEIVAIRDAYEQVWKDVVLQGEKELGWRVTDGSVIAFGLATMCTAVATWYKDDGRLSPDQIAEVYAELALGGVKGDALSPRAAAGVDTSADSSRPTRDTPLVRTPATSL